MDKLFEVNTSVMFQAYAPSHFVTLVILLCCAILLFVYRNKLRHTRYRNYVRIALVIILILSEISLNIWYVWQNLFDVKNTLPLELCSISLYLCIVMLIWRSERIFHIVYFTGIGGAIMALLTPSLDYAYPHFRFIEFFAAHMAIILSVLYMVWIEQYRPTLKSVFLAMGFLNILLLVVGSMDYLVGANYMFLAHKPSTSSLLDVLGPYPWYLLSLEIVAFILFLILYLPFIRKK
ncbi:TIGR02206 family membrane protein [Paenibacillus albiflavus]|uniref:TIGR02206 family membrane protein n=1 Tax=Paenibacillus albiflavus TaxID=2545760 RepID=A0A4R4EEW9_9BACL|nr:TIGR02206 family membrane protein [Paenibacillus albiflavus]TCZ77783.1 TIGR02206 family membrane protein [Paenibacillus albiflavus]